MRPTEDHRFPEHRRAAAAIAMIEAKKAGGHYDTRDLISLQKTISAAIEPNCPRRQIGTWHRLTRHEDVLVGHRLFLLLDICRVRDQQAPRDCLRQLRGMVWAARLELPCGQRIGPALHPVANGHELALVLFAERPTLPATGDELIEERLICRCRPAQPPLLRFVQCPLDVAPAQLVRQHARPQARQLLILPIHWPEQEADLVEY